MFFHLKQIIHLIYGYVEGSKCLFVILITILRYFNTQQTFMQKKVMCKFINNIVEEDLHFEPVEKRQKIFKFLLRLCKYVSSWIGYLQMIFSIYSSSGVNVSWEVKSKSASNFVPTILPSWQLNVTNILVTNFLVKFCFDISKFVWELISVHKEKESFTLIQHLNNQSSFHILKGNIFRTLCYTISLAFKFSVSSYQLFSARFVGIRFISITFSMCSSSFQIF